MSETAVTRRTLMAAASLGLALVAAPRAAARRAESHRDRIDSLIARMTIQEKAGQLTLFNDPFRWRPGNVNPGDFDVDQERTAQQIRDGHVGALFNGVGAEQARYAQRLALEESRLGIPMLFAADIIHGLRTTFPTPLGEAASWDMDLAERTAR